MLDDALTNTESEIQSAKFSVSAFKVLDDAQGVKVVIEAEAVFSEGFVKGPFSGMPKRWMTDIVDQGKRFGKGFIEAQRRCDSPRDLRHLHGMSEAAAEVVGVAVSKDLSLAGKTAKGARVDDARAITLEGKPVGMGSFRVPALD